ISPDDIGPPNLATITKRLFNIAYRDPEGYVDLVPGSNKLMYLVLGKSEKSTKPMETRFHLFIERAEKKYDLIFIDCHPAGSFLTKSALMMSDMVITPVVPDSYSQRGLVLMSDFIEYISNFGIRSPKLKVVFNKIQWSNADQNLISSIRQNESFGYSCIESVLHVSNTIADSAKEIGPSWRRMMQWSKKPWKERVKIELNKIFEELFESSN
ncbi:MAG: ParA family protein, partial [Candidatus Zixiibacteriota bacterium]